MPMIWNLGTKGYLNFASIAGLTGARIILEKCPIKYKKTFFVLKLAEICYWEALDAVEFIYGVILDRIIFEKWPIYKLKCFLTRNQLKNAPFKQVFGDKLKYTYLFTF